VIDSREFLSDALRQANANRNRMIAPQLGRWEITVTDTETRERLQIR